jgi:hypothetical protein
MDVNAWADRLPLFKKIAMERNHGREIPLRIISTITNNHLTKDAKNQTRLTGKTGVSPP